MVLPICKAKPVVLSGQGAQLAVLPDLDPQPKDHTSSQVHSTALAGQRRKFTILPNCKAWSSVPPLWAAWPQMPSSMKHILHPAQAGEKIPSITQLLTIASSPTPVGNMVTIDL